METQNHLCDGVEQRYFSTVQRDELLALADRAIGATTRLMNYLRSRAKST